MERELHVRWMFTGPGGWVEKRAVVKVPSIGDVLVVLSLLTLALELWRLWKG